jgi:hypothetical protein
MSQSPRLPTFNAVQPIIIAFALMNAHLGGGVAMKYAFRFFALAVLAVVALTARAQKAVMITGYQPGEFAVKNGIEQQLDANVVSPIASVTARANGEDLRIFVTGYADKTGSGAENDRIALARAEQVKEFLLEQFPKATITDLTKGDEANARMVMISWKITAASPTPLQKKSNSKMIVLVVIIGFAIFIIIVGIARPKATQPMQFTPPPQVEAIPAAAKPATSEIVPVEKDGNIYDVPIELKNGIWRTPFPTQADATKIVFRKDRRDAVKAVKACIANPFYAPTIKQLIANGTIMVRKGEVS